MPSETAILYPPKIDLDYGAYKSCFENDWIRFYTDEEFICNGTIPISTPFAVKQFDITHKLFTMLAAENFLENKHRDQSIRSLFKLMFYKLEESLEYKASTIQDKELLSLRLSIQNDPGFDWTISYMAKLMHFSPCYLHAIYKNTFGVTCMEDVINMRIKLAKELLRHSDTSIRLIANHCGYKNVEHFSRQFHDKTGMAPNTFRKNSLNNNL